MPVRLTEALLDNLKPSDRDQFLFDALLATFGYRLTPAGTGIFFVDKPRRRVGFRPPLKVADARELARQMLVDIRAGRDPALEIEARARAAKAGEMTVGQLAEKWMVDYVRPKLKPRTVFDYERLLAQHILPAVGHLSVARINRDPAHCRASHSRIYRDPGSLPANLPGSMMCGCTICVIAMRRSLPAAACHCK